ncbi:MAG: GNAT family N-acetyltransferase [Hyphomicrobiaceae bacterium]
MQMRSYRSGDAAALAGIFRRAVAELGGRHYTSPQVAAWLGRAPDAEGMAARAADGRVVLVAVDDADRPVAFADLEPNGHVDLLFALPEVAGTGVAQSLVEALEVIARSHGMLRLFVEASEGAKGLFARQGFLMLGRNDFTLGGTAIHNYRMEKALQRERASDPRRPPRG